MQTDATHPAPRSRLAPHLGILGVILLAAGGSTCQPGGSGPGPGDLGPPCDCYVRSDCPEGSVCQYNFYGGDCTNSGKYDGICISDIGTDVGGGIPMDETGLSPQQAGVLVSTGFDALVPALLAGGGHADAEIWAAMEQHANTPDQLQGARILVHTAVDATLGWDLNPTVWGDPHAPANVRLAEDPPASLAMLEATRLAVVSALETQNPDAVSGPLVAFWDAHPTFEPGHLGRCYPHGHEGLTDPPILCQIEILHDWVSIALSVGDAMEVPVVP